jgi:hypothetical protein
VIDPVRDVASVWAATLMVTVPAPVLSLADVMVIQFT